MKDANSNSRPAEEKENVGVRRLFVGALAACALVSVALYNGYPTIFSDTGGYLLTGKFLIALPPFRAPGYALFTKLTSLGTSAWFTIVVQAAMAAYVLYETCDYLIEGDRKFAELYFLGTVCVLTALTSLPWLVSLVMPDFFAGLLFLAAFLLAFAEELKPIQRIVLAAIFTISIGAHASLLPIAVLFLVVAVILRLRHTNRTPRAFPSTKSVLAWLLVPILAAGIFTAALNSRMGLGFRISPSRNAFLLARLFGDGLAADFLRKNCPQENFISCGHLSDLPQTQEEFLFHYPTSLYAELNGHEDEMEKIVSGTIRAYPVRFIASSAKETLLQLASLRTGDEIRTYGAREWNSNVFPLVFPGEAQALRNGKEYRNRLTPLADFAAALDVPVFWLSVVTCLLLARMGRFGRINLFFYSALAYLLINAAICATFAGVYDRYQERVAWILPLCLTGYVYCLAGDWKRSEVIPEIEDLEAPVE